MSSYPYQPYYCEENVWRLCRLDPFESGTVFAVVISNERGACPMWYQRAAPAPTRPVFWDYHVVALASAAAGGYAWDLDSRAGCPVPFDLWWERTFPALERVPEPFVPQFRVVEREVYLDTLSSDRSHMQLPGGDFKAPPPSWTRIYDADLGMNLDRFVDMQDEFVGTVLSRNDFVRRFSTPDVSGA